jgi:hypothetical protein
MHMTVRTFRQTKGTPKDAATWVKKTLMPALKKTRGFKAYYACEFDDGTIGSVSVFSSETAAKKATTLAMREIGSSASDMLKHVQTREWRIIYEHHA